MSPTQRFSFERYDGMLAQYCDRLGWQIWDMMGKYAELRFKAKSGRSISIYVTQYDSVVEFTVRSSLKFASTESIPGFISNQLLQRNSKQKIGFWCIEKMDGKYRYEYMHNIELQSIDINTFKRIISTLIKEGDRFEGVVAGLVE